MILALQANEIDVAVGLTEGWVAALGKAAAAAKQNGGGSAEVGFRMVGRYVDSPLCWAISTGAKRSRNSVQFLNGSSAGISRVGR